jgi:hypothetical protein
MGEVVPSSRPPEEQEEDGEEEAMAEAEQVQQLREAGEES